MMGSYSHRPGAVALSLDGKERQNIVCPYSIDAGNLLSNILTFYVPRGVAGGGHPTAKMGPYVRLEDIPQHLLVKFETDKESAETWEGHIMEAIMYTEDEDDDDYKMKTNIEEDPEDFEDNSTIMSGMDEGYYDDVEIRFDWEQELEEYDGNDD